MKYTLIDKADNEAEDEYKWHYLVKLPFLLGLTFGAGCYIAKVIINSPFMNNIVLKTAEDVISKTKKGIWWVHLDDRCLLTFSEFLVEI